MNRPRTPTRRPTTLIKGRNRVGHVLFMCGSMRRAFVVVCLFALAVTCVFMLSGCKDSRAIKNIIHDQNAEKVDHESGETYRITSEDGRFIDEDTGLYEIGGKDVDSLPANVVYVSKDPETELATSRFIYDENSTNDSEATEGVRITPPEQQPPQEQEKPDQQPDETSQARANNNGTGNDSADNNTSANSNAQDGTADSEGGWEDPPSEDNEDEDEDAGLDQPSGTGPSGADDDEDDKPQVYDASGKQPEVPEAGSIAAYGQVAVLVQMLGGTDDGDGFTPLAAADDELCAGEFARVFSDEGVDRINSQAFIADGSGGYEPNIDQIIAAKPDTVLVFSDGMFSKDEKKKLKKNGISITVVPALTSDTGIMRAAEIIAKMLDESTGGRSTGNFELYRDCHDALIADVEGVRGYGSYDGVIYDANRTSRPASFAAQKFTLVIDEWDFGASYSYRSVISDAGAGVGLSTVGFRSSPVSYYLGVAGVVNNAAAIDTTKRSSGLLAPAWQFNPSDLSPSNIRFSNKGFSSLLYENWGTGFTKTTLSKVDTKKLTLRDNGFGTETFPVVIVATDRMRDSFLASANAPDGIYHPFGYSASDAGTFPGTLAGRTQVFTVIDENLDTSAETNAVIVNPHGLFSSWLEGSAESFLECAWAATIDDFDSDWDGSAAAEVKAFYETFYRYDISDGEVEDILDGLSG